MAHTPLQYTLQSRGLKTNGMILSLRDDIVSKLGVNDEFITDQTRHPVNKGLSLCVAIDAILMTVNSEVCFPLT